MQGMERTGCLTPVINTALSLREAGGGSAPSISFRRVSRMSFPQMTEARAKRSSNANGMKAMYDAQAGRQE